MTREGALVLVGAALQAYNLKGWTVRWLRSTRVLGRCFHYWKQIGLSVVYIERNDAEAVMETVLHEVAHALAGPEAGHGPLWQEIAVRVGAQPTACKSTDFVSTCQYAAECPCGTFLRHGRPRKQRQCGKCSQLLVFEKQ